MQSADGTVWFSPQTYPQRHVNLRGGGATLSIFAQPSRRLLGKSTLIGLCANVIQGPSICTWATPIISTVWTWKDGRFLATEVKPAYFTRVLTEKTTHILVVRKSVRVAPPMSISAI